MAVCLRRSERLMSPFYLRLVLLLGRRPQTTFGGSDARDLSSTSTKLHEHGLGRGGYVSRRGIHVASPNYRTILRPASWRSRNRLEYSSS